MEGEKPSTAKPSKTTALSGQRDLFHFYQKRPRFKHGRKATTTSGKEATASISSGEAEAQALLKEDMHTNMSISETNRRITILEVNSTISGGAVTVRVPPESQRLSACIDPPLWGKGNIDGEPARTSGDPAPHPSQAVITVDADKRSAPLDSEAQKSGSFVRPLPRKKSSAEVASASISQETFEKHRAVPNSPRAVGDDGNSIAQDRSSSKSYKISLSKKHVKSRGRGVIPDVIDLTVSRDDGYTTKLNTSSPEHRRIIVVNEDEHESTTKAIPFGSQGAPIDLISSPNESRPVRVLHPFFARQVNRKQKDNASASCLITSIPRPMQVPWPSAEEQHNTGPQTPFSSGLSVFGKYLKTPAPVASPSSSGLGWLNSEAAQPLFSDIHAARVELHTPTSSEHEAIILSLPNAHREHPGISRFFNEPSGIMAPRVLEDGEMWSQRWKPRRAAEVLGNEDNALYLKAWLQALTICARDRSQLGMTGVKSTTAEEDNTQGKRPMVVRAVTKKRGRKRRRTDSDDSSSAGEWIVDDEEAMESEIFSEDEPFDWSSPRAITGANHSFLHRERHPDVIEDLSSSAVDNDSHFPEFTTLTNTILLAGPPGSGKSSTIYACAEELGWEVFEVHPGIGKRSGSSLSSLIGNVGKNHHVGRRGGSNSDTKRSSNPPGFGYIAKGEKRDSTQSEDGKATIRQSVILLDEVDVLFKEDANFWPTVVNIIKFSHRPVFMTCNDPSLIPQDDLPLQTCLHFKPCPPPLAVSFLQCVCLAEGHIVPREQLEIMYDQTYPLISCDEPDIPSVPYPSQQPPSSDLRQVLNNLQFWCTCGPTAVKLEGDTGKESEASTNTPGITARGCTEIIADWARSTDWVCGHSPRESQLKDCDFYRIERHADSASYIDGCLERRPWDVLEALAADRYGPSGDDEIGYTLLDKPTVIGNSKGLAFYNRDAEMACTALVVARHVFETSGAGARARDCLRGHERGSTRHMDSRSLRQARVAKQTLAVSFLDDVMTAACPLLPRAPVILEYTPYVRHMVLTDDMLEAAAAPVQAGGAQETGQKRGRPTRTRWRTGEYPRHIAVSAEGLEAARNMLLGINP